VPSEAKTTKRPLKLSIGSVLPPFGFAPPAPGDTNWAPPAGPGSMTNVVVFDVPPDVDTVICTVQGMAMSADETAMVSCDELTSVTGPTLDPGLPELLQVTFAPEMKLLPFTVSVKDAPPAVVLMGESDEMVGAAAGVELPLPPPQPESMHPPNITRMDINV